MVARSRLLYYRLTRDTQRDPALSGMGRNACAIQSVLNSA